MAAVWGIGTSEATYWQYAVKVLESLTTTTYYDGPTDHTDTLMSMINSGKRCSTSIQWTFSSTAGTKSGAVGGCFSGGFSDGIG